MPRGYGRLDVRHVSVPELEQAVRHPCNIRVGATNNPLARAHAYEQGGVKGRFFVGSFLYCQARNARAAEDRLLHISAACGRGALNQQWTSNYPDRPGYVYVILGRPVGPGMPPPPPDACCTIM